MADDDNVIVITESESELISLSKTINDDEGDDKATSPGKRINSF